ncbi:hypothetical protein BTJ40_10715 [Microbulbifer sp. A4B17]|uniref:DUF6984 family protein n=1 Tax=Microbulbifer sp. A4B17 TaxID=359370 RepID=UPI000D52D135|nr:hypothetical protein [Microbulbifer sp. A4B17]AWF81251.1 hypothetical protein BTJ40_10715 [Microbulbifer sp. A4B17]
MNFLLSDNEKNLILAISSQLNRKNGDQLRADLKNARVESRTSDGSRVSFDILGYERPQYRGQHPYEVEGKLTDEDGGELSVLLYADENDRLLELEIIRWDGNDLINPNWGALSLYK